MGEYARQSPSLSADHLIYSMSSFYRLARRKLHLARFVGCGEVLDLTSHALHAPPVLCPEALEMFLREGNRERGVVTTTCASTDHETSRECTS